MIGFYIHLFERQGKDLEPYARVLTCFLSIFACLLFLLGHLEWEDVKTKNRCVIMWRTPEEWADMIYTWVRLALVLCLLFFLLFFI